MSEQARTRTRVRPNTATDRGDQSIGGSHTAKHESTSHKPSSATSMRTESSVPVLVARVTVTDGVTLNMGDYNSFRRDVGLELDVVLGPAEGDDLTDAQRAKLDQMHDKVRDWVQDRLADVAEEAQTFFEEVR